jgi:flavin-binding protein dodecin
LEKSKYFVSLRLIVNYKIMSVLKVIEVLSSSPTSWEDATQKAVAKASRSVNNIRSAYVQDQSVTVKEDKVIEFRVNLKLTFELE